MKKFKRILLNLLTIFIFSIIFVQPAFAFTESNCKKDAIDYYGTYGFDFKSDSMACMKKYPENDAEKRLKKEYSEKYQYAINYVTRGGESVILYLNEVPQNFDMWNTDILIQDGRVVVIGTNGDDISGWNLIFSKYKHFIMGFLGVCTLTCLIAFVLCFIRLGSTGSSSNRKDVITGILWTGIGTAGLGGVMIIFAFFYNAV